MRIRGRSFRVLFSVILAAIAFGASAWAYEVTAWTFGDLPSLDRATSRGAIDEVNVDWYLSNADASLVTSDENLEFVAECHRRGLRVFATVSNYSVAFEDFDSKLAHRILRSTQLRNRHVTRIAQLCAQRGYDGIDLDWESVYRQDRGLFTKFVQALAANLHRSGRRLSIAVHAKTSEPGDWFGAAAEDYARLGAAVDEFKIMTYDYSGSWSDPGPVSPPAWADAVLTFAESVVSPSKILMGVPFYGYDWSGSSAQGVSSDEVQAILNVYHPTVDRDASGEATFAYSDSDGLSHVVYFQDRAAIAVKLNMLRDRHPAIRGICIWVMGGERAGFWDEIVEQLRAAP